MRKKNRSKRREIAVSDRRGPAAGRRAQVAKVAARPSRKASNPSVLKSKPESGIDVGTLGPIGSAPASTRPGGKMPRTGRDFIDWRYLTTKAQWDDVLLAIMYYKSSFTDTDSRDRLSLIYVKLLREVL